MEKSRGALENKWVLVKLQESKIEQQRSLPTLGGEVQKGTGRSLKVERGFGGVSERFKGIIAGRVSQQNLMQGGFDKSLSLKKGIGLAELAGYSIFERLCLRKYSPDPSDILSFSVLRPHLLRHRRILLPILMSSLFLTLYRQLSPTDL